MILIHVTGLMLYLVLFLVAIRQRGFRDRIGHGLFIFFGLSFLIETGHLIHALNLFPKIPAVVFGNFFSYSIFLQSAFLFNLSTLFFQRKSHRFWWLETGIILTLIFSLDIIRITKPYVIQLSPNWSLSGWMIFILFLLFGWGSYMIRILWLSVRTYRKEILGVTLSRIRYWSVGFLLILGGDILILIQRTAEGGLLKLGGVFVISFVALNTRLPDLRGVFTQFITIFTAAFLELLFYSSGFLILFYLFVEKSRISPILLSVGSSFVLLVVFNPFNRVIKKLVNRTFLGVKKDDRLLLSEYSKKISNVLDLDLLSKVIFDLLNEWIDVERGSLFIVDTEVDEISGRGYRMVDVLGDKELKIPPGFLSSDSQLTTAFLDEKKTLTISEIDLLPEYQSVRKQERNWFKRHQLDIFFPIFGMDEWIGILALGSKTSGGSYSKSDIRLLEILADQTSVALQNARLVESIVRVNNEFRKAYTAMEEAHTKLEHLERTKSDFISIASHELRTPLTVLSGYSQMLMEDPTFTESDYYYKVIKGIEESTSRLHEIVDSMLEIAKIDTRQLELRAEQVMVSSLIHQVTIGFKSVIKDRSLNLTFENLEQLPPVVGDSEALNKVFYHLISNAIKYTPDGGNIVISGVKIPKDDPQFVMGGVEVVIKDSGIGIEPRYLELIFTKFYQTEELSLHSSGKTKFKGGGPGLGLAIVRGIVLAHGGRVWAESPGSDEENPPGSDFHVVLPANLNLISASHG